MRSADGVHLVAEGEPGSIVCRRAFTVHSPSFSTFLAKELGLVLGLMINKSEPKLKHSSCNNCGTVKYLSLVLSALFAKPYFKCKPDLYFFLQACELYDSLFTTICVYHIRNARSVCNMPSHVVAVYQHYSSIEMSTIHKWFNKIRAENAKYILSLRPSL